jgi:hypothetical protein
LPGPFRGCPIAIATEKEREREGSIDIPEGESVGLRKSWNDRRSIMPVLH